MQWQNSAKAYKLIETLVLKGKDLPIDQARVDSILHMKEPASTDDLRVLQEAVNKI